MTESLFIDARGQIATWLAKQPHWYSYALHIATRETYTQQDIDNLAAAACAESGLSLPFGNPNALAEFQEAETVSFGTSNRQVILKSITAEQSVNALVEGASLTFAQSGLTVIYGSNGSGKTGFCRLLRNASTSRLGPSDVLPNAFEQRENPKATYEVSIDGDHQSITWVEGESDYPQFPEVMFFDAACAAAEIQGKKNDVLYVPPILELLDHLSGIVNGVANRLQQHSKALPTVLPPSMIPPAFREVELVSSIIESDDPSKTRVKLAENELSTGDLSRMKGLPKLIESDPSAEIPKLQARIKQLNQLRTSLLEVYKVCDQKFESERVKAANEQKAAKEAVEAVRNELANSSSLDGVGNDAWKALWQAAREYSETYAYPGAGFPPLDSDAVCPLCQQPLSEDTKARMGAFEKFMNDAAQKNLLDKVAALKTIESSFTQTIQAAAGARPSVPIIGNGETRAEVDNLLEKLSGITDILGMQERLEIQSETRDVGTKVHEEIDALNEQLRSLEGQAKPGTVEAYKRELLMLQARSWMLENKSILIADAETRHLKKQIETVRKGCSSLPISRLVSAISQTEVVERMQDNFANELEMLKASSQRIYLKTRTQAGKEYQELSLDGAVGKTLGSQVLSEGEQKIAAIAAFFTLLDVSPNRSTVIFDDPVTSLDHNWSDATANRIVVEAQKRPVIVFTHDQRFCGLLSERAKDHEIPIERRTITRHGDKIGIVHDGPTWDTSSISQRIGHLNATADAIAIRLRNDEFKDDGEFEGIMRECYSELRTAWEKAVDEVLLSNVAERIALSAHALSLRDLTDISQDDIGTVTQHISKCSAIAEAQADPFEEPYAIPGVKELRDDIAVLDRWVEGIKDRRMRQSDPIRQS